MPLLKGRFVGLPGGFTAFLDCAPAGRGARNVAPTTTSEAASHILRYLIIVPPGFCWKAPQPVLFMKSKKGGTARCEPYNSAWPRRNFSCVLPPRSPAQSANIERGPSTAARRVGGKEWTYERFSPPGPSRRPSRR